MSSSLYSILSFSLPMLSSSFWTTYMSAVSFFLSLFNSLFFFELCSLPLYLYLISLFSLSMLTLSHYALVISPSIFFLSLISLSFFLSLLPRMRISLSVLSLTSLPFTVSLCLFLHWCSPVFLAIPGVWRHPARWQGHPDHRLPSHQVRSPNISVSANLGLYHRTFLLTLCQVKAFDNKTFLYPLYRLLSAHVINSYQI